MVSSLPAIVVDGSKSFSFPGCSLVLLVSSTTPGSVSLVHGFTNKKSVIHSLKRLALVNGISGLLYLVDPMWIFSSRIC